ncbi:MAG: NnrS family protein, partial [Thiovulaceae bacterium]|nr:NnrS family protein [Sulfurimonadaceae bacterium]
LLKEFWRWKLNTTQAPAILKILHVALFWLPLGLLLGAVTSILTLFTQQSFLFSQTHLIALGFIVTMLIGFGTRVTLGHSGQPPHADQTTLKIFYLTQLLVFVRFALSLSFGFDSVLLWLFDLSAFLWLLLFIFWVWKFGPVLVKAKL